eukprot:CAMPEP_0198139512 /NCGR_PEP_ID=MMETSP1443-20131203/2797_1 /TAXON_ID=186043 /ORGANISM="Entomoneis sp., Strain CCMP2396" /LENGTH=213 /DNA_ID=CAMNT_0043801653 /DNA_START=115 /DNA_END=752 /DNA_ORIENTATION=-
MMLSNSDSCHSTIAVDSRAIKTSLSVAQPKKSPVKAQRKVRFNECRHQYFADSRISVEDDDEGSTTTWYASTDYGQFRSNAQDVILGALALKDGRSFVSTIEHVYDQVCQLDYILEDADEMMNSELEQQINQLFLDNNIDLIGLESYVSFAIKKSWQQKRENIQDAVYDVQSEFELGLWEVGEVDEELRNSCQNFSQPACLFAQLVAKGQASV